MLPYYTLLTRDGHRWCIEFGDYDLTTVQDELGEYLGSGWKRTELKIITTSAKQSDIEAAVRKLNEAQK